MFGVMLPSGLAIFEHHLVQSSIFSVFIAKISEVFIVNATFCFPRETVRCIIPKAKYLFTKLIMVLPEDN